MTNENKPDNLEMEKIKLERLKVYGKIITVLISVGIGTFGVAYINHIIQNKRLEGQLKQQEMKYLGDFLSNALDDSYEKRFRFADYFATLTSSPKLQQKWIDYRDGIVQVKKNTVRKEVELAKADDEVQKKVIRAELVQLQAQLEPLRKKPDKYDSRYDPYKVAEHGLDKNHRPLNFIDNEYELHSDGKVVFDKATGLMWQRHSSNYEMPFNGVEAYLAKLNSENFAGYNDWRLPTLEEAISLIEPRKYEAKSLIAPKNYETNTLCIDSIFAMKRKKPIWTSTLFRNNEGVWIVYFNSNGSCYVYNFSDEALVLAVR